MIEKAFENLFTDIITTRDLVIISEEGKNTYPTLKVFYKRVFLAEVLFNNKYNLCVIFFNNKFFEKKQKEIIIESFIEDIRDIYRFNLVKEQVKIIGSVMKEINPRNRGKIVNNISYENYKQSYDIFNKCFDERNNKVWKVK